MKQSNIQPRVLRLRDAPAYLGMDIHRFNEEVRPALVEISIGKQGVGFDRLDFGTNPHGLLASFYSSQAS